MPVDGQPKREVQVYVNGEKDGFPVRPDAINADCEGFTLVFDPETRWFPWVRDGKRNSFKTIEAPHA